MGVVYRARHLIWNEEKALKVLVASGSEGQPGLKSLMAEALVMRQLQHPHIVRVEDADYTEDDQPFVVMEYVDGQSLRQKLDRAGPLAPELALQITAQTCSALSAAHQKGIVHRDIKPQNLLLAKNADGSETVKVIDFGIAKVREEAGLGFTGMMTGTTGLFVGTPGYASPEQALGMRGSDLDGRTDLYSLGLVLYEMLTGRLPFAADTPVAVLVQRLQIQPLPPDRLRPDLNIPPDVSKLVMKALEKERESRYRSAEEMERAITAVLDSRRIERERREREAAETTRLAAERAERERRERERADAARLAAERAEQERRQREAAEAARLAAGQAERERHERETAETTSPAAGRAERERPDREVTVATVIGVAALALLVIGFFVARSLTEKTAQDVREQKASVESLSRATAPPAQPAEQENEKFAEGARSMRKPLRWGRSGLTKLNQKDGLRYVWISRGTFTMGCSTGDSECGTDEKPAHEVTITKGFWLGQTEVTQAAYERIVGAHSSHFKGANLPVEQVSWSAAQAYCQAVGGRLPTEAEWEYAARAGSGQSRYGDIDRVAWHSGNSGSRTHEVARKEASAWGLYDMLGNVWEWTADWYGSYAPGSAVDPTGPASGQYRALRGGSWGGDPWVARVSVRDGVEPGSPGSDVGLRCVGE
jgi:formylglycine-generating enzyme required for sulfatase activity